jgi:hypothetical protein
MRNHILTAGILTAATLLTRIPFVSGIWHYDSVNFAIALEEFSIAKHQPHPPGYILYIGLGRALNLLLNDANNALVTLSILFSCVAVVWMYLLGRAAFGYRCGLVSAVFLLSSPVFWASGELPLSYAAIPAGSLWVAYAVYKVMQGQKEYASWASIGLGILIGIRQDMWIFLLPLWMAGLVWLSSWKAAARQLAILGIICLLWVVPLMILSGGIWKYWDVSGGFWANALWGKFDFTKNIVYIMCGSAWTLGAVAVALPAGLRTLSNWMDARQRTKHLLFLSLWAGPALLFYLSSSIGKSVHAMKFMLPIFLLSGAFACGNWSPIRKVLAGAIVTVNCLVFLLAPPLLPGDTLMGVETNSVRDFANFWMLDYSRLGLLEKEKAIEMLKSVRENFSPDTTAVAVADVSVSGQPLIGKRLASYHLPKFTILAVSRDIEILSEVPPTVTTIVWLVGKRDLAEYKVDIESFSLATGTRIYYSRLEDATGHDNPSSTTER